MTKAYKEAKRVIKQHVHADKDDVLIFCGSGMTAAVNKLQRILGLRVPERLMDYVKKAQVEKSEQGTNSILDTGQQFQSRRKE